jgi:hypothetical protein
MPEIKSVPVETAVQAKQVQILGEDKQAKTQPEIVAITSVDQAPPETDTKPPPAAYHHHPPPPLFTTQFDLSHQHNPQPAMNPLSGNFLPHYAPHSTAQYPSNKNQQHAYYPNSSADFYSANRSLAPASTVSSSVLAHHQHPIMINNNPDHQQQVYIHQQMMHNSQNPCQLYQQQQQQHQYQNSLYHQQQMHMPSAGMHQIHGMILGQQQQASVAHHLPNPHTLASHHLNISQQQQMSAPQANLWATGFNSESSFNEGHLNRFKPVAQNFSQQAYVAPMHFQEASKYHPAQFSRGGGHESAYGGLKTAPFISSASDCELAPKLSGELVANKEDTLLGNSKPSGRTSNSSTPTPIASGLIKPIQASSASPALVSADDKIEPFLTPKLVAPSLEMSSSGSSDMSSSSSSSKSASSFSSQHPDLLSSAFNYSSYVLFPSDPFGLSEPQQEPTLTASQLQKQNSSYFPIEDVLANLMR